MRAKASHVIYSSRDSAHRPPAVLYMLMSELDCHLQLWYKKQYSHQHGHDTDHFPPPPYPVASRGARVVSFPLLGQAAVTRLGLQRLNLVWLCKGPQ